MTWQQAKEMLRPFLFGINANEGTDNCGHVVISVDAHFRAGRHLGGPAVPTESANMYLHPATSKEKGRIKIIRSFTKMKLF